MTDADLTDAAGRLAALRSAPSDRTSGEGDRWPAAPEWYDALNDGKEIVAWDAAEPPPAALLEADVVLEGFRPGVWERLGVEVAADRDRLLDHRLRRDRPASRRRGTRPQLPRLCRRARRHRAGAAARADRRPRCGRAGRGDRGPGGAARARAHGPRRAHRRLDDARRTPLRVASRWTGDPVPRLLTGGVACYRIYETADGRFLTVAALEPKFWQRLCELLERPDLDRPGVRAGAARARGALPVAPAGATGWSLLEGQGHLRRAGAKRERSGARAGVAARARATHRGRRTNTAPVRMPRPCEAMPKAIAWRGVHRLTRSASPRRHRPASRRRRARSEARAEPDEAQRNPSAIAKSVPSPSAASRTKTASARSTHDAATPTQAQPASRRVGRVLADPAREPEARQQRVPRRAGRG